MAEPTISLGWDDFAKEVAYKCGYGYAVPTGGSNELVHVTSLVRSGLRQVIWPQNGYRWSWMSVAYYSACVAGTNSYNLPDDCAGGVLGIILHHPTAASSVWFPVQIIGDAYWRTVRQLSNSRGQPRFASIRPLAHSGSESATQRYTMFFWPTPDLAYTISMTYEPSPNVTLTAKYPPGPAHMSEVYLASCLSMVEYRVDKAPGPETERFMGLLSGAIDRDRALSLPEIWSPQGESEQNYMSRDETVTIE